MPPLHEENALPKVLKTETVFEESFIKMEKDLLQIDSLPPYPYYTLKTHPSAVVVLAVTPDNNFLLIEEYRHPTRQVLLSCPAGYIDGDEEPIAAARRELLEETGYDAKTFTLIGSAYPFTGFSGQKNIFILATETTPSAAQQLEHSEVIRPVIVKPQDLFSQIKKGIAIDSSLSSALYFYITR